MSPEGGRGQEDDHSHGVAENTQGGADNGTPSARGERSQKLKSEADNLGNLSDGDLDAEDLDK